MNKILIITAFPFNNKTAGQAMTNSVIDDLKKTGYEADGICFSYPTQQSERKERFSYFREIKRKRPYVYIYQLIFFWLFPMFTRRLSIRVLLYLLRNQSRYSYIYLDYTQVFIYSLFIRNSERIIFNVHDLFVQRYSRVGKSVIDRFILRRVYKSEFSFYRRAKTILVPSIKDKKLLYHLYKKQGIPVLPKKILSVNSSASDCITLNLKQFVFLGAWNRYENIQGLKWFLDNVHPVLNKGYSFIIIGGNLPEDIRKSLPGNFSYAGFVDDFSGLLLRSSALICPLFIGAGIKFKVLNGLSNGCRIVGTPVALEGIEVKLPCHFFECKTAHDFVKAMEFCSMNAFKRESILEQYSMFLNKFDTVSNLLSSSKKIQKKTASITS